MTRDADICIFGGRVFDGSIRTESTAIAIAHGRIIAVGTDQEVHKFSTEDTQMIDAQGGAILPGFVDAHVHAVFAGVERMSLDLTPAESVEETLALIKQAAASLDAEGESHTWLIGGGWAHELFAHPTKEMLDEIVPDRPVALSDAGHHTLWVNSAALRLANITGDTPQPANGHIYLGADGEPTGYLNEGGVEAIAPVIPEATIEEMRAGLLNAQNYLWSLGVTGWHEAILGEFNGKADPTPAYTSTMESGELKSSVSGALWIPPGTTLQDIPELIDSFEHARIVNGKAGLISSTCKAMIDGVPQGETAALLEPYCSHAHSGELHLDEDVIHELIRELDVRGFALHLHIMGDRGIRVALDAIAAARVANGPGPRHHIAHLSMVEAEDARRFGPLGVTANIQGLWATQDPSMDAVVGEARAARAFPFRELIAGGADFAMGSDWPVSPPDPWQAIHVVVNRAHPVGPSAGMPPLALEQALSLTEALYGYTSGSSQLVLDVEGRIRVGARADVIVSTRDPFEIPASELYTVKTAVTVVAGDVVYNTNTDDHAA